MGYILDNLVKSFPPNSELPALPLFVYGTLRVNGSLHNLLEPYILGKEENVYVNGSLYSSTQGLWPVVVLGTSQRTIGSLLYLKPEQNLISNIVKEELLWGYDLTWTDVFTRSSGEIHSKALVCSWSSEKFLGSFIASGDWFEYLESN